VEAALEDRCCTQCGRELLALDPDEAPEECEDCRPETGAGSQLVERLSINLRRLRQSKGLDQAGLAERAGLHASDIWQLEGDRANGIRTTKALKLAHAVVGDGSFLLIGLGNHRVHPLQHPLGDARGPAEPGRRGDDQNLGIEDLRAYAGPLVALAHLRFDAGRDRVVDRPHRGDLDPIAAQCLGDDLGQRLGVRLLGARLQRAVDQERFHWLARLP